MKITYNLQVLPERTTRRDNEESAAVHNITCSIARIDELSERIVRNAVTPLTLQDVISDWL